MPRDELKIFACRSGKKFGERVVKHLISDKCSVEGLAQYQFTRFECGENKQHGLENSVRDADVYIIQSCANDPELGTSVDDNSMELLRFINGMEESSAGIITAIVPMLPYSRQDKIWERGEPYSAKLFAKLIKEAGADRMITMDLHADQIKGFYDIRMEALHASHTFLRVLREEFNGLGGMVFCSTDAGGARIARHYAKHTGGSVALGDKIKVYDEKGKEVEKVNIIGEVESKTVVVVDDMVDTGGSIIRTIERAVEKGAKEVYALAAHAILSEPATERFQKAYSEGRLKKAYFSDSIVHSDSFLKNNGWFKEISVAPLFARVIQKLHNGEGVSEVYL